MAVPMPTGVFTVRRPTGAAAPVEGHATYRGGIDPRGEDGRKRQVGDWSLALDPAAWPVTEDCLVDDDSGRTFRVHAAALRDAGDLAHVTVDCDLTTVDTTSDTGTADADGNVQWVPA